MSFTDESTQYIESDEYIAADSPIGKVFIPKNDVDITGEICIRYEKHPWLEQFEFDGMRPRAPQRKGYGLKTARPFTESLAKIYAKAYDDYALLCDEAYVSEENRDGLDITSYYSGVSEYFVQLASGPESRHLYRKYCGFAENLWREGTKVMHDVAMQVVLPIIENNRVAAEIFYDCITPEFKEYIKKEGYSTIAE